MSNNLNQLLPAWKKEEFPAEQIIGFLLAELVKGQLLGVPLTVYPWYW